MFEGSTMDSPWGSCNARKKSTAATVEWSDKRISVIYRNKILIFVLGMFVCTKTMLMNKSCTGVKYSEPMIDNRF